jgi:ATP/maltotriose-dependent transcriptional regulator MalT
LTQRELEVLRLLGEEKSNQEIAQALTIELGTVKNHVHNLLRKLDVCSRKHAAQLARQMLPQ